MGTSIESDVVGDNCVTCTPDLFASGETPKFVVAHIFDIHDCGFPGRPVPPDGMFILQQRDGSPCRWLLSRSDYFIQWDLFAGQSLAGASWGGDVSESWFLSTIMSKCEKSFVNQIPMCLIGNNLGTGGTMTISW